MRATTVCLVFVCFAVVVSGAAQQKGADPLSGTWAGDWGPSASDRNPVTVELKWDGKTLSGTVNPGEKGVPLEKASFDPKTNALRFEAHAKNRRGEALEYKVEGKLEKDTIT